MAKMLEAKATPTTVTYNAVINACAKSEDVPSAERWLAKMLEADLQADVVS